MEIAIPLLDGLPAAGDAQTASVRALTGRDEALLDSSSDALPAERVTGLLAGVTARIGDQAPVTPAMVRRLTVGDRERLLIGCAAATLGTRVEAVARCPHPSCGELIELSVDLGALLQRPDRARPADRELQVRTEAGARTLRFRLPTGADLEAAARASLSDPAAGRARLLDACLVDIVDDQGRPADRALDAATASALEQAIHDLDPVAEILADGDCPACGRPVHAVLDGFALLASGIASGDRLLAEIDGVARAYHWSEAEILSLPLPRRRRYLDLIRAQSVS
jgi:hypothetical protein